MILNTTSSAPVPELVKPAGAGQVLKDYEAIDENLEKITGSMPNNGAIAATIDGLNVTSYTIPSGYTSGGTVSLTDDIEAALAAI